MRLIDADALLQTLVGNESKKTVKWCIKIAPTVDAVSVVRCKDCVNYDASKSNDDYHWCRYGVWRGDTWYCASGERRNGNEID